MTPMWISVVGMACPVGLYSAAALAAMRAGLNEFELDDDGEHYLSRGSYLEPSSSRAERSLRLMELAFSELLPKLLGLGISSVPLVMALPSPAPYGRELQTRARERLTRMLAQTEPPSLEVVMVEGVTAGRAGCMRALSLANDMLSPRLPFVLVGALDSLVDGVTIGELERARLLLSPSNPDGRVPGEAAVFVLVSAYNRPSLGQLVALEQLQHPATFMGYLRGENPAHGAGLTQLFDRLEPLQEGRVSGLFSAQPHGDFWSRELSYAYLRSARFMPEPLYHRDVGSELGDVGAAAGGVALLQALDELNPSPRLQVARRETALVYAVSDRGDFGGCVLRVTGR